VVVVEVVEVGADVVVEVLVVEVAGGTGVHAAASISAQPRITTARVRAGRYIGFPPDRLGAAACSATDRTVRTTLRATHRENPRFLRVAPLPSCCSEL